MVSDFIEEASGDYLHHNDRRARILLETQSDGYFESAQFLHQVDTAIDIFEAEYPNAQGLFLFDNAPCHRKCPEDAGVPHTLAKLAICYCILHFGY